MPCSEGYAPVMIEVVAAGVIDGKMEIDPSCIPPGISKPRKDGQTTRADGGAHHARGCCVDDDEQDLHPSAFDAEAVDDLRHPLRLASEAQGALALRGRADHSR